MCETVELKLAESCAMEVFRPPIGLIFVGALYDRKKGAYFRFYKFGMNYYKSEVPNY